jgi:hypothetical protein
MSTTALFIIEGSDLESTKKDILKIIDPDGVGDSDDGDIKLSKSDLVPTMMMTMEFDPYNMHFMIPMEIFEGMNIEIDHLAAKAFVNPHVIAGKKYVFLDDNVAALAARQCRLT